MKVSELTAGMLIKPKNGCAFYIYESTYTAPGYNNYAQLECKKHSYRSIGGYRTINNLKYFDSPIVYIGTVPKEKGLKEQSQYQPRHEAFVTCEGKKMRVAPEAWRNMEPVQSE